MKKFRKYTAIIIAALFITSCLSACGSKDTASSETSAVTAAETAAEATAKEASKALEENTSESKEGNEMTNQSAAQDTELKRDGEEHEEMTEVNNVRLSVKEAGSGRDMILIHGRTLSKEDMDPLFQRYKNQYNVVSYDVRGHGKTESSGEFTLDDLSDDLVGLMSVYHLENPIVIGFSMGSYIALRTAERNPNLFSGIVLIGTRGGRTSSQWPATDEVGRALESYDNMTDAPKATLPVLVLTGENDTINPPDEGKKVADALPNAVYKVVPGAEHMAYEGNPDFVFEQIDEFLERLN